MTEAQIWLNKNYPSDKRSEIISLDISGKDLKGSLNLEGFVSLKKIDCSFNELTDLQITGSLGLEEIRCQSNQLRILSLQGLSELKVLISNDNNLTGLELEQNKKLESLNIMDNNFSEQDLSFLKTLTKLKNLRLGNWMGERINWLLYNRFNGSLETLKNMNELNFLDIRNTDVDSGLEHLSSSVQFFNCSADIRENADVEKIYSLFADRAGKVEVLKYHEHSGFIKDFPEKLRDYKKKVQSSNNKNEEVQQLRGRIEQLQKEVNDLNNDLKKQIEKSNKSEEELERKRQTIQGKQNEINDLKQQVNNLNQMLTGGAPQADAQVGQLPPPGGNS